MLQDFITRIQQSRFYQQARTIWRVASGKGVSRKNEGVDLFLGGQSVQKISALLMPGIGGPRLIARQLEIQADIREYTLAREKEVLELKDEVGELRQALASALKASAAPTAAATPAAAPGAPAELLGELLGIGGAA